MDSTDTMIAPQTASNRGLHQPFLERAAGGEASDRAVGLGAFLVMRLVDQFRVDATGPGIDAIGYQCFSTRSYIADIRPQTETSNMLYEVTRVAQVALESDERRLLFPPLLALAFCLEEEFRLFEALDVLQTTLCLSDGRDAEEELGVFLHRGRLLRNTSAFDEARTSYERAGGIALRLGDKHSELLSRIGRGIVARQVGNLPDSEHILRGVIAESQTSGDSDAEARASQDLAGTLYFSGRIPDATPFAFKAYELYDSLQNKARALSDTGAMLKALGHYNAARNAYSLVLSYDLRSDIRVRTEVECLEVSALTRDRVSFERWRQSIAAKKSSLPHDALLDFELQTGIGLSMFDEYDRAEDHILRAIALAEEMGMGERVFYAERRLAEVREQRRQALEHTPYVAEEGECTSPVRDTIERLEDLVTTVRG